MRDLDASLRRWTAAGLLEPGAAERIRAYEAARAPGDGRWPVVLALAFGGLLLAAAILLFVAAHWDGLAPAGRFLLVTGLLAGVHLLGALAAPRFDGLAAAAHGVGTAALGAAVFLVGQIFHLETEWPTGLLLWAAGAWAGVALRRDWIQLLIAAVLTPAWLLGEWAAWTQAGPAAARVGAEGVLLLALVYLAAAASAAPAAPTGPAPADREPVPHGRIALAWAGGLAVLPAALAVLLAAENRGGLPLDRLVAGRAAAYGLPLVVAFLLRGREAWAAALAAVWVAGLGLIAAETAGPAIYGWLALGAVGLVGWGIRDGRGARVNLGVAGFALTVLAFYFSSVMDRLGRSLSLAGLGVLFLAGGWALERARRRLVARARAEAA